MFDFADFDKPARNLASGFTNIVTNISSGLLNTKNKAKQILHDVSPNVLGPVSDALDPEWLTGVSK